MQTKHLESNLPEAAELLRQGGLVAVPTETVYGLAGNGLDEKAVERIYEVKGRPQVKPLSLMVPGPEALDMYGEEVPAQARKLADCFWPGPLTLVLKAKPSIPEIVRAGGATIGLRCPDHPLTLALLQEAGIPFAAPSANPSGEESPKTCQQVLAYFDGRIDAVIDGGPCGIGKESTLLDMSQTPYRVLRQGALPEKRIAEALAENTIRIGITGGTGCGKTTALLCLQKRGALILDCDEVYHQLLNTSKELLGELDAQFPGVVEGGELQRKKLGAIVFANPQALQRLNEITHRHIREEIQRRICKFAMDGGQLVAIDAIELISSGLAETCQAVVGIVADTETRIQRIVARDGISNEYARMRVEAQRPNSYFEENCDYTLENNGDMDSFSREFDQMMEEIINNG